MGWRARVSQRVAPAEALVHDDAGADVMYEELASASLGAGGPPQMIGGLGDNDVDVDRVRQMLGVAGERVVPVWEEDAELAGVSRAMPGGQALSLGDRCCLALTLRSTPAEVLAAKAALRR